MALVRVAEVIASILVEHGITDVFMVTGGGAMHLNDAFGRESGLRKIFPHHEQSCAIAAESYARTSGRPAAINLTTGPGGINAINGVFGAFVDSIPMIVVSGQVKRETYAPNYSPQLRQLGDQEANVIDMVRGITKYATVLQDPQKVRKVTEKAIWLATRGRPGPVWIDVPVDIQGAKVDPDQLESFDQSLDDTTDEHPNTACECNALTDDALDREVKALLEEFANAKRPAIMVGYGIRASGTHDAFLRFIDRVGAPVLTAWNAHDALHDSHRLYAGRPGIMGDRGGNFAVQTADYVLVLGSRASIRQVGYDWKAFARNAKVAMVDIDTAELAKPTLTLHRSIHADLRDFFAASERVTVPRGAEESRAAFVKRCRERSAAYPVVLKDYWECKSPVNPYCFLEALFGSLDEDEIVVTGNGSACVMTFQCALIKPGQRLYTNSGCASMGYDLPAAMGAYYSSQLNRVICLTGDGSIMMNLQELQTIASNKLPIKIFVINNDGYHSIRQTQDLHFGGNRVGCGPSSGVTFPDFTKVAAAFGIRAVKVADVSSLSSGIAATLQGDDPALCEVIVDTTQAFSPKLQSRRHEDGTMVSPSLEDMAPFLSRDELNKAMDL